MHALLKMMYGSCRYPPIHIIYHRQNNGLGLPLSKRIMQRCRRLRVAINTQRSVKVVI
jgi:hypothetical protein